MTSEDKSSSGEKIGVYVCYCGGNISDHVDVEEVAERLKSTPGVTVSRTNMFMCSDPGQELIAEDIRSGKVDRVVVASCAPSLHELTFRGAIQRSGLNPYLYEHANIREQVSWVHHGQGATDKATDLVRAAVSKTRYLKPLEPIRVDAKGHATVIGGGVAGLRAARDLSGRGLKVLLIEKSPFLGGRAVDLDKLAPTGESAGDLVRQLAETVLSDPNIEVMTCAEMTKAEGYVGNFRISVERRPPKSPADMEKIDRLAASGKNNDGYVPFAGVFPQSIPESGETVSVETGAMVFATGFKPYKPQDGEFGFGDHPEVITLPQLTRILAENQANGKRLELNGRPVRRMGMVHCVGSRQIPGIHDEGEDGRLNEYCSRVCCTSTLDAANRVRDRFPMTEVFDFYRDIRTYGRGHEDIYAKASGNRIVFMRYEPESPPTVGKSETSDYPLNVRVNDMLTFGEEVSVDLDLLVLSVGMEPNDIGDLVDMLKLPRGADGFLQEVHPKLRPVELANQGVFLAGTCQTPMDIGESCAAAQAAASKVSSLLSSGYVELDPFVAEVAADKCKARGECVSVCPEKAISMNSAAESGPKAEVNPALCTGCGICVPTCPENAIEVCGWTLKQYEAMVDAIAAL